LLIRPSLEPRASAMLKKKPPAISCLVVTVRALPASVQTAVSRFRAAVCAAVSAAV